MTNKLIFSICLVVMVGLISVASVNAAEIRVDLGQGAVEPGWTQWAPQGFGDAVGTTIEGVDFTIVGPWDDWRCRVGGTNVGDSDNLTYDCVSFADGGETGSTLDLTIP